MNDEQFEQLRQEMGDVVEDVVMTLVDKMGDRDIIDRLGLPVGTDEFLRSDLAVRAFLLRMFTERFVQPD